MLLIDPTILKIQVDNYFEQIAQNKNFKVGEIVYEEEHPTVSGLALFLGFPNTKAFERYKDRPEYADVMDYALLRIENQYEKLYQDGVTNAKSAMKRFGWDDKQKIDGNFTLADFIARAAVEDEEVPGNSRLP